MFKKHSRFTISIALPLSRQLRGRAPALNILSIHSFQHLMTSLPSSVYSTFPSMIPLNPSDKSFHHLNFVFSLYSWTSTKSFLQQVFFHLKLTVFAGPTSKLTLSRTNHSLKMAVIASILLCFSGLVAAQQACEISSSLRPALTMQFTPSMPTQRAPTSTIYGAIMTEYLNVGSTDLLFGLSLTRARLWIATMLWWRTSMTIPPK